MRRLQQSVALLMALLAGGAASAAEKPEPGKPLLDLYYGDVLFYYFQGDDFEAMTRLMAARAQGRTQDHVDDGDLLMAGLQLSFGQTRDAITGFGLALKNEPDAQSRNRIRLALARALHLQGADVEALTALSQIDGPLSDDPQSDLEADRRMLAGEMLIETGRYDEAVATLQNWKGSRDWMPYARYNTGVALIRAGRVADGEAQLDEVDRLTLGDEEQLALRDRANTALGYTHLQAKQWDAARTVLRRVRLKGPSSNRALLGLGWAESELGRDRQAMVPWTELTKRDAGDPAVQEALLALPYATARVGSPGTAADRYDSAFERFDKEAQRLTTIAAAIAQPAFIDRLLEAGRKQDETPDAGRPLAPLAHLPDAPEYRALSKLIASDAFQAGLQNTQRLSFLRRRLDEWAGRVPNLAATDPAVADWAAQAARVSRLGSECERLLKRQRSALEQQATAEIQLRRQRLVDYQAEARYAQAHVLDRSANTPKSKPEPRR